MANAPDAPASGGRADARFGFWAALATAVVMLITILTPPKGGQLCKEGCYAYPFLDVASRFPRDYLWMYPGMLAMLTDVAFTIAVAARAAPGRRLQAQFAVVLSAMAASTIVGDYFVQLAVVQPSLLAGEADGISLISQYNEHGVFIALEELGYFLISGSLACLTAALSPSSSRERAVRFLFVGGFAIAVAALAYFVARHAHRRGYLFEVAIISIVWLTAIPGAGLMALVFRSEMDRPADVAHAARPSLN